MKAKIIVTLCVLAYVFVALLLVRFLWVSLSNQHRRRPPPKVNDDAEGPTAD